MVRYTGYDSRSDWPSPELATLISLLPKGRALDIGCGHGTEALTLAAHGWRVLGINPGKDGDEYPLAEARRRRRKLKGAKRKRVQFVSTAVEGYELPKANRNKFDLVLDRFVYNTFLDPKKGTGAERRGIRLAILSLAAEALCTNGVFLLRLREEEADRFGRAEDPITFPTQDLKFIREHFSLGPVVGALGLATDARDIQDMLVMKPVPISVVALRRLPLARKTTPSD